MDFKELMRTEVISPLEVFDYINEGYWRGELMSIIKEEKIGLGKRQKFIQDRGRD